MNIPVSLLVGVGLFLQPSGLLLLAENALILLKHRLGRRDRFRRGGLHLRRDDLAVVAFVNPRIHLLLLVRSELLPRFSAKLLRHALLRVAAPLEWVARLWNAGLLVQFAAEDISGFFR